MSESGYQEIDLDNPSKAAAASEASDIEIVEESVAESPPEAVQAPAPAAASTRSEDDESDDESPSDSSSSGPRRQTRSQRLKNQRDIYARQLTETQARLADAENRARRYEADANEGAAIGFDLYAKQLDTAMQALRRDFDQAFDSGDREKIFDVQQRMSAGARVVDQQMVRDGYTPEDPDYFEELDKRLQQEFPHKLGRQAPARQPANNPTIQNRSTPAPASGKVRVIITQDDREMANHLGITVEQYAREKVKTERAAQTVSQYTEIL